jgi:hypothetical protein
VFALREYQIDRFKKASSFQLPASSMTLKGPEDCIGFQAAARESWRLEAGSW